MNVMFVSADNNKYSGAFRSMVKLIQILTEEYGHSCMVVLPWDGHGQELLEEKEIRYEVIRSDNGIIKPALKNTPVPRAKKEIKAVLTRLQANKLAKLIRSEHIDILHINASDSFIGAWAAGKNGTPYVWHIREFMEEDHGMTFIHPKVFHSLMRKADRVIAISNSIKDKYEPFVGEGKITTIFNGIDASGYLDYNHEILRHEGNESATVRFLMVGRLVDGKGQKFAIEACARFHERNKIPFVLNLVGDGNSEYTAELEQLIREHGLEGYVKLCGASDDVPAYYRDTDIFLMCSKAEAFGRVTVEAMMGGCLVIGNNTAGTRDLIKDGTTGLLYENQNTDDLVQKIEYALEHKEEAQKIAAEGRRFMAENMTAEQNAENINNLYLEVIGGVKRKLR